MSDRHGLVLSSLARWREQTKQSVVPQTCPTRLLRAERTVRLRQRARLRRIRPVQPRCVALPSRMQAFPAPWGWAASPAPVRPGPRPATVGGAPLLRAPAGVGSRCRTGGIPCSPPMPGTARLLGSPIRALGAESRTRIVAPISARRRQSPCLDKGVISPLPAHGASYANLSQVCSGAETSGHSEGWHSLPPASASHNSLLS